MKNSFEYWNQKGFFGSLTFWIGIAYTVIPIAYLIYLLFWIWFLTTEIWFKYIGYELYISLLLSAICTLITLSLTYKGIFSSKKHPFYKQAAIVSGLVLLILTSAVDKWSDQERVSFYNDLADFNSNDGTPEDMFIEEYDSFANFVESYVTKFHDFLSTFVLVFSIVFVLFIILDPITEKFGKKNDAENGLMEDDKKKTK